VKTESERTMKKHSKFFLLFLLAIILQFSTPSQTTTIPKEIPPTPEMHNDEPPVGPTQSARFNCLPEGFQLSDIVTYRLRSRVSAAHITIEDKLGELKATCKRGKLLDSQGKEIRFFKFSCFGNPPEDYREIAQKEGQELEKLQKQYHVIILQCDPRIQ
jgi:hypothetical protein